MKALLCWERNEARSWTPELASALRDAGDVVLEAHDLDAVRALDPAAFDVVLPRFRASASNMDCLDDHLVRSGVPMLNSRDTRLRCENKALAHLAFEIHGIRQPRSFVVSREGVADREAHWHGETLVKPLNGSRSSGIEILPDLRAAVDRAAQRHEDLLVQEMIWPARSWRIIVGRETGIVDPYWRRPPDPEQRILAISTGSTICREEPSSVVVRTALEMRAAVDGDLLAVDVLERSDGEAFALEINHNFDAHGGTKPAVEAFRREMKGRMAERSRAMLSHA